MSTHTIEFSEQAASDLENIKTYFSNFSDTVCDNVLDDIFNVLEMLKEHPDVGRWNRTRQFRIFPSPRYRFIITYVSTGKIIEILAIFRYQDRSK